MKVHELIIFSSWGSLTAWELSRDFGSLIELRALTAYLLMLGLNGILDTVFLFNEPIHAFLSTGRVRFSRKKSVDITS